MKGFPTFWDPSKLVNMVKKPKTGLNLASMGIIKNKKPGAGGEGTPMENGLLQAEPNFVEKLANNDLKLKDVIPGFISEKVGEWFSNSKIPAGYENDVDPAKFVKAGLNLMTGADEKQWQNPEFGLYPEKELDARDFLNRKSFGMGDIKSARGKEQDILTDLGNNNYEIKRDTDRGDKFYRQMDKLAKQFVSDNLGEAQAPESVRTNLPVMSHYSKDNLNFAGEGEDENGYYNLVRLNDLWDYKLNSGEKMNSLTNIGRTLLDQFMTPANVTGTSKVYIPKIKKKPRRTRNKLGEGMDADLI